ncbi:hypothetical protein BDN71DRAFT_1593148 [Pleurotus eryngii]|uniref:DUF6533 domain-containing protein n=1 Tax=Pleurotus eryngii TaxID=5323 RepID=A0A9P5ZLC7_PLEER|nr:hypothetical protein BDN71DRAFT_1593148 [Pleurotus eryngii]
MMHLTIVLCRGRTFNAGPVALPAALATLPHNRPAYGAMDTQLTASSLQIQNNVKSYLSLAAVTILYYDYWLTLPLEIERYWTLKGFTTARFLFYLNRYTSLFAHVPVIVAYFWTDDPFNKVDWAIASSDDGHSNPDALQVQAWPRIGCIESLTHTGGIHLAIAWACLLVFDISIYVLTLRKAFGSHRVPGKSLVQIILRDASVYIAVILVINMSIVLTLALAPAALKGVSTTFSSCVASVIVSRLLFNLRDPSLLGMSTTTVMKSEIRFAGPAGGPGRPNTSVLTGLSNDTTTSSV